MSLTTITVTGHYEDMLGRGASGTVTFTPETDIFTDHANDVIYTRQIYTARLTFDGKFSIVIPCTDVDSLTPTTFTYTVEELVTGMNKRRTTGVVIDSSHGETVDITDLF